MKIIINKALGEVALTIKMLQTEDYERTCRMIEKMPRIVKEVKYLLNQLDFCETFQSTATGLLRDIINYIENGDRPIQTHKEMLKYLLKCYKAGNLLSVVGHYMKEIEELCAKEDK